MWFNDPDANKRCKNAEHPAVYFCIIDISLRVDNIIFRGPKLFEFNSSIVILHVWIWLCMYNIVNYNVIALFIWITTQWLKKIVEITCVYLVKSIHLFNFTVTTARNRDNLESERPPCTCTGKFGSVGCASMRLQLVFSFPVNKLHAFKTMSKIGLQWRTWRKCLN